jgi:hypothetical protein
VKLWGKDKIFIYISILFVALTAKKLYSFVQVNQAYSLRFSPQVSEQFKQSVKQYLKDNASVSRTSNVSNELASNFGLIKFASAEKGDPFKCHLKINCMRPLVQLKDKIVAEDFGIYNPELFANYSIPAMQMNDLDEVYQPEFKTFLLQALEHQLFDLYEVEWKTKNYILLKHKENKDLNFLTRHSRVPTQNDVDLVEKFVGEKKGSRGYARADLRFAGQVVTSFV